MATLSRIPPPGGKLLVLTPGIGAVSTTFFAGVEAVRCGRAKPIGSLTQMQRIRPGRDVSGPDPLIKDFLPLADLRDLEMAGWDAFPDDAYDAARRCGVLTAEDLAAVADFLRHIRPMPAVFDRRYVRRLEGTHVKRQVDKIDLVRALREDIRRAKESSGASRAVMVWCGSTEAYQEPAECHASPAAFERGLRDNDPAIAPSQLYAYASVLERVPFANGAPNLSVDVPALEQLAAEHGVAIAGKDFKTGQTLIKTALGPAFKSRVLGVDGWFSTNILGNRDGEVLADPGSLRAKEETKRGALDAVLDGERYPDLYGDLVHQVRINYYPPRGDAKEAWDSIDLRGWLGYRMQLKINFLTRDSILAAPVVLDLALLLDLAQRRGWHGVQEWLAFYFKSPHVESGGEPGHDLFSQYLSLENAFRALAGSDPADSGSAASETADRDARKLQRPA